MENSNTFLDNQLYNAIMHCSINSTEDFANLTVNLYLICEKKWKSQLQLNMKKSEVKTIIDRTFASWNLFIKRLRKDKYFFMADFLEKHSYKDLFMKDEKLKEIYNNL